MSSSRSHPSIAFLGAFFFFLVAVLLQVGRIKLRLVESWFGADATARFGVPGCLFVGLVWIAVGVHLLRARRRRESQ